MGFLGRLNRQEREANREIVLDSDAAVGDRATAALDTYMGSGHGGAQALRTARHIPGGKFLTKKGVALAGGGLAGEAGVEVGMRVDGHVEDRASQLRQERQEHADGRPELSDLTQDVQTHGADLDPSHQVEADHSLGH
jgi:hypothetical protein